MAIDRDALLHVAGQGMLVASNILGTVIMARALLPVQFGAFVLLYSSVLLIDRLLNFQSWQAVVRFSNHHAIRRPISVFRAALFLDATSAILATGIAAVVISSAARIFGFSAVGERALFWAPFLVAANINGAAIGALRSRERFGKVSAYYGLLATGRLVIIALAVSGVDPLPKIIQGLILVEGALNISVNAVAWHGLAREKVEGGSCASLDVRTTLRVILPFAVVTNSASAVRLLSREPDLLAVGAFLGPEAAGRYRVARQIASLPAWITDALAIAAFPRFVRAASARNIGLIQGLIWALTQRGLVIAVTALTVLGGWGQDILVVVFGQSFSGAYAPMLLYAVANAIACVTLAFVPTLLAFGKQKSHLTALIVATLLYLGLLKYAIDRWGVAGAAGSYVLFYLVWSGITGYVLLSLIYKRPIPVVPQGNEGRS